MKITCSGCGKELQCTDDRIGERIHCPACGETVKVPVMDDVETLEPWAGSGDSAPQVVGAPAATVPTASRSDTKTCPMCGQQIKAVARKCRFCGESLAGNVGLDSRPGHGIWREGNRLVMAKDAQLPYVCIKTNQPADAWLRRNLYWHAPWIYLLILISILVYAIVALIVRESARINVALCHAQIMRRRWTIAGAWLAVAAGATLFVLGAANSRPGNDAWIAIPVGLIVLLAGAIAGATLARIVAPTRITKEYVWLKGVHPDFLATLPEFPRAA